MGLIIFQFTKLFCGCRREYFGVLSNFTKTRTNIPRKLKTNFRTAYLYLIRNDKKLGNIVLVVKYLGCDINFC